LGGFPKRVRAKFGGATVADSRGVKTLHETGHMMVFYFPRADVTFDRLRPSGRRTQCPHKGEASYWSVAEGGRTAENAAWSYDSPIASAAFLAGYIAFEYGKMDSWYEEDDRIYAHPRDPYHRFDIHGASRTVVIRHGDTVIAESKRPRVLFETGLPPRFYLPPDDVRTDLLERSAKVSQCPYKGDGQHWHLKAGDQTIEDAAWSLPDPLGEANKILGYFCLYPEKVARKSMASASPPEAE
jgi:Uncharacterized protein conserved in bacteria